MGVKEDISFLEKRIKEFHKKEKKGKKVNEYIVQTFENYLDYLRISPYKEYFIKKNGKTNIPEEMKKEKKN